jgi:hypothetical protein
MIALNRRTKIFVCKEAAEISASYDSLFNKVKITLDKDPFSCHLFLFVNRTETPANAFTMMVLDLSYSLSD